MSCHTTSYTFPNSVYCQTVHHAATNKGKSSQFDTIHYIFKTLLSQYLIHCYSLKQSHYRSGQAQRVPES